MQTFMNDYVAKIICIENVTLNVVLLLTKNLTNTVGSVLRLIKLKCGDAAYQCSEGFVLIDVFI